MVRSNLSRNGVIYEVNVFVSVSFSINNTKASSIVCVQCVSVNSASFVIYPELEATEVRFSAFKRYLCSFYFRIDNETGGIQ